MFCCWLNFGLVQNSYRQVKLKCGLPSWEFFLLSPALCIALCPPTPIRVNPFTPESDQCLISPAASQEIWHHTVWRTWLFIAYSDDRWLYYKFLLPHSYFSSLKGWENVLFKLRSERVIHQALLCILLNIWGTGIVHNSLWGSIILVWIKWQVFRACNLLGHLKHYVGLIFFSVVAQLLKSDAWNHACISKQLQQCITIQAWALTLQPLKDQAEVHISGKWHSHQ